MNTMDTGSRRLTDGVHAVLFALFSEDGSINEHAMGRQIDRMIDAGVAGIAVLGLATEVGKLSLDQQLMLIKLCGRQIDKRVTYSVTITGETLDEYYVKIQASVIAGANWLILQPPSKNANDAVSLKEFFTAAGKLTQLPFALQNAPVFLSKSLSARDIGDLSRTIPNLIAVKAEENVIGLETLVRTASSLEIVGGRGGLEMTDALRAGCRGFVLAPDIAPRAVRIYQLWAEEKTEEAEALYVASLPAIVFVMQTLDHLVTYGKRIYGMHANEIIFDHQIEMQPTRFGLQLAQRHGASLAPA